MCRRLWFFPMVQYSRRLSQVESKNMCNQRLWEDKSYKLTFTGRADHILNGQNIPCAGQPMIHFDRQKPNYGPTPDTRSDHADFKAIIYTKRYGAT